MGEAFFEDKMQLLSENFAEIVKNYNLKEKKISEMRWHIFLQIMFL